MYGGTFLDVSENAWYYQNVVTAYDMGLMNGISDTAFDVRGGVTVAQAITMACRLHSEISTGGQSFEPCGDSWYQVYLDYAESNGIATHYYDSYDRPATRAEFAELLSAAFPDDELPEISSVPYNAIPDVEESGEIGRAVYRLYRAGVLTGSDETGAFLPEDGISRAEAAAIVTRMAKRELRQAIEL